MLFNLKAALSKNKAHQFVGKKTEKVKKILNIDMIVGSIFRGQALLS